MSRAEIRILVADDEPDILDGTVRLLAKAGYVVDRAATGEAALEMVERHLPGLVLLDRNLPDIGGLEVCRHIKQNRAWADVLVVIASNSAVESDEQSEALESGADSYVVRPISNREWLARVEAFARIVRLTAELRRQAAELRVSAADVSQTRLASLNLMEDAIAARDRAEQARVAISASEGRYRRLFEASRDGILIVQAASGEIVDVNPFLVELLGAAKETLVGRQIWAVPCFKDVVAGEQHFAELLGMGSIRYDDVPLAAADGRRIDVEILGTRYEFNRCKVIQCNIRDITERKRVEQALKERQEIFASIVGQAFDAIVLLEVSTGRFVEFNTTAHESLGYSREEFAGFSLRDIQAAAGPAEMEREIQTALQTGGAVLETRHRHRSGALRDVRVSTRPIRIRDCDYLAAVWSDITESKRVQTQLAHQAQLSLALLELPQAAERMDEKAFMQRGQEMAEDLTGSVISFIHFVHADQETIELVTWSRRTLEKYCHAAYDNHYPASKAGIWADALREKKAVMFNDYAAYPHKHGLPHGHSELKRLISVPVIEHGKVVMLAGVGNKEVAYTDEDVSTVQLIAESIWRIVQRRRSEAQLRKLSLAVEQNPASIVITDLAGSIEYVNPRFTELTGYTLDDVRGQNPRILKSGLTPAACYTELWAALSRGQVWRGELINRKKNGEIHIELVVITPVKDAQGRATHFVALKEDITERKRAEDRLRKMSRIIEQAPLSVAITDLDGAIEYINPKFAEVSGYTLEEVRGQNPRVLKSGATPPEVYREMWQSLARGQVWRGELHNRKKTARATTRPPSSPPWWMRPDGRPTMWPSRRTSPRKSRPRRRSARRRSVTG